MKTVLSVSEQEFKTQFIIKFLASWCANNYQTACSSGNHEWLEKPPVEDADFLAKKAWDHWNSV